MRLKFFLWFVVSVLGKSYENVSSLVLFHGQVDRRDILDIYYYIQHNTICIMMNISFIDIYLTFRTASHSLMY